MLRSPRAARVRRAGVQVVRGVAVGRDIGRRDIGGDILIEIVAIDLVQRIVGRVVIVEVALRVGFKTNQQALLDF